VKKLPNTLFVYNYEQSVQRRSLWSAWVTNWYFAWLI